MELSTRRDPELREGPIEVKTDRPMGEEEPRANLPVGQALCGHVGDLQLLWRELIP
jgi:hypothetical protein